MTMAEERLPPAPEPSPGASPRPPIAGRGKPVFLPSDVDPTVFDEAFLRQLERLLLLMRAPVRGGLKGGRRSVKRGQSVEFADYREYALGDDLRQLDWNVLARLEKLFVKLFIEEEDVTITVLLDGSASMATGRPSPVAAELPNGNALVAGGNDFTTALSSAERFDPPTAVDDSTTVAEDSFANAIDVLANDTGASSVEAVDTTGTKGMVTISPGGADVEYIGGATRVRACTAIARERRRIWT